MARNAVAVLVVEGVRAFAGDGVGAEVGGVHPMLRGWSAQRCVGISRISVGNEKNVCG